MYYILKMYDLLKYFKPTFIPQKLTLKFRQVETPIFPKYIIFIFLAKRCES